MLSLAEKDASAQVIRRRISYEYNVVLDLDLARTL